jgi:hypothetical protein
VITPAAGMAEFREFPAVKLISGDWTLNSVDVV